MLRVVNQEDIAADYIVVFLYRLYAFGNVPQVRHEWRCNACTEPECEQVQTREILFNMAQRLGHRTRDSLALVSQKSEAAMLAAAPANVSGRIRLG